MAPARCWLRRTAGAATAQPLTRLHQWAVTVRDRRGHNKATIAVANKLGRIVWAVWHKDVPFAAADAGVTARSTLPPEMLSE